jgi:hypothetical protein
MVQIINLNHAALVAVLCAFEALLLTFYRRSAGAAAGAFKSKL